MDRRSLLAAGLVCLASLRPAHAQDVKSSDVYPRLKAHLDAIPAIDTHDHLPPFDRLRPIESFGLSPGRDGKFPRESALRRILATSYYPWTHPLSPWRDGDTFDAWWARARHDFDNARAATFYRYLLPAFRDLYGVDFDTLTDEQARDFDRRIAAHYQSDRWLHEVIRKRANIDRMLVDPWWAGLRVTHDYPFSRSVCNINTLISNFADAGNPPPAGYRPGRDALSPAALAREHNLTVQTLDDYDRLLDLAVAQAKKAGAPALKCTVAYGRTLQFDRVPRDRAAAAFARPRQDLSPAQVKDVQDHVMWRLTELAAKYDLPFQVHTGHARIQGSNPMLLVDLIEANPKTKFVLFHGGFPWVSESGLIAMKYPNVWLDSCWLPTLGYTLARRGYQEWFDMVPSNRILWGADGGTPEAIYGATVLTRQCLAEALAEKVLRGELREADAKRIGQQILRDNALALYPTLRDAPAPSEGK